MTGAGKYRFFLLTVWLLTIPGVSQAFEFEDVIRKAQKLAEAGYVAPEPVPQFLRDLTYSQHEAIRFRTDSSLWHESGSRFQVSMIPPGNFYSHAVGLNVVDQEGVHNVPFQKDEFVYPNEDLQTRVPADLGFAGFELTYPLENPDARDQFLVFGGASYFRGTGAGQQFGLSARGVAINTGLPSGEEFPSFTEFWLVRPSPKASSMVVYALLDGPSLTGAYQFIITPGEKTRIEAKATLFFRNNVQQPGLAPLTSMFYYGENSLKPLGEWRPEVHDSDGLLIHDGATGEWLWRPLENPKKLRLSYHQVQNLQGFGLMQRDQSFQSYEDNKLRYERRPSTWVEADQSWGSGNVVLVEIPTGSEDNDNIVAFWTPDKTVKKGDSIKLNYTLVFGQPDIASEPTGHVAQTFVGRNDRSSSNKDAYRFVVDFEGDKLSALKPNAAVVSSVSSGETGEVLEHFVQYVEATKAWRLSFLARPEANKALSLRGFLSLDGKPLTETWTYELGADNELRKQP
ncbi:MAG TPA: glucan biosynthesis protein G [Marinobacter sp.]|nr:glucan biosynthesis protein G [Marinobacter sp.]